MGGVCSFFFGCCGHQTHDPKGTTLVQDRSCTDKLILLLYIAAWVLSIIVISTASGLGGNPQKIIRGIKWNGDICGYSSAEKDHPYAALVSPFSTDVNMFQTWTCVDDCNKTKMTTSPDFAAMYGSTEFFGYCIPTFDVSVSGSASVSEKSQFDNQFDSYAKEVSRGVSDLANAWAVILISAFWALFFSYVYMWLTKRVAGLIIWLCILLVIVGGFFVGYSFLKAANDDTSGLSDNRITTYRVAGYIFIAATSVFVLVILGLSSQIKVAVEVVKAGSMAINDMKFLIFWPIFPLLICAGYIVYWIYGALFIFSVSDLTTQAMPADAQVRESTIHTWTYYGDASKEGTSTGLGAYNLSTYTINTSFRPLAAYHVFHLLWTVQFIVYFGYFVIAGAVCGWYFTLSDAAGNKIIGGTAGGSHIPVLASVWRTVRYHLGTIAFASLIIAIVNFIRVTVKYIEMKTRTNPPSYLQKAIFCLIQCCLKCIECCLDKISKNALVWCAMWGDPFLSSACSSFALLWRNLGRVAAVHIVSDIILGIGKVAIAAMTIGLSAIVLQSAEPWKSTVSSAFVPCILIGIISYCVAWLFFLTFETVIDTTFLCFLVDSENHEKHPEEAMFAPRGLQELVGKYQLRSAMEAESTKQEHAELYKHLSGVKVADEHEQAVAQLNRAISTKRATTGNPNALAEHEHKAAWGENVKK